LSVIEHLEREDGEKLLAELERVSSGLALLTTPVGKCVQRAYDGNPYQEHKHIWSLEELKIKGFNTRGIGLKGMAGERWDSLFPFFLRPLQYAIYMVGTSVSYFFPRIASGVVVWKEKSVL
jgi:hypothetical protein